MRRKKTKKTKLTDEEVKTAAARLMAAAQAHQRASVYCMNKPDAKPPNIDWFFFNVVSIEMILLSVEQSLRLLLLLHYRIVRDDTNHTPRVLYQTMTRKSGGAAGIRAAIVAHTNAIGSLRSIPATTEKEILACLNKHNASYTNFRYFQLNQQGKVNPDFGFKGRDLQILHTLALALISLNTKEMKERKIGMYASMSVVSESEMTDDLRH
ncbi:MAG: hypothetical protein OXH92_20050 [Bryobacterales bacterium]|nr:hypothetical protein [Bryobacterales bacterium]